MSSVTSGFRSGLIPSAIATWSSPRWWSMKYAPLRSKRTRRLERCFQGVAAIARRTPRMALGVAWLTNFAPPAPPLGTSILTKPSV